MHDSGRSTEAQQDDEYSLEDLEELKVVLIKEHETADDVPETDPRLTSSIHLQLHHPSH